MDGDLLIHPGEVLKEEFLAPYELSANRLAKALRIPTNRVTEIINGERGITGETAILLGHAFGTSAEFWLNLQARYELDRATSRVPEESIRGADALARELAQARPASWASRGNGAVPERGAVQQVCGSNTSRRKHGAIQHSTVMTGLGPVIHDFPCWQQRSRGWPGQARP